MKRILWAITGSGDKINDVFDTMIQINDSYSVRISVIVSKAGEQVLRWYGLWEKLNTIFKKVEVESNANNPFVAGPLQVGHYDAFVVAPLTANSAAKIALGIADTLITNAVAQTLKGPTPVFVYPVDQEAGTLTTIGPNGENLMITTRSVDLENVERLKHMRGLTVLPSSTSILPILQPILDDA